MKRFLPLALFLTLPLIAQPPAPPNPQAPTLAQKQRLSASSRPRGVRIAHRTITHQLDWVTTRLPRWGFTPLTTNDIPAVTIVARERISFAKTSAAADTPGFALLTEEQVREVCQCTYDESATQFDDLEPFLERWYDEEHLDPQLQGIITSCTLEQGFGG